MSPRQSNMCSHTPWMFQAGSKSLSAGKIMRKSEPSFSGRRHEVTFQPWFLSFVDAQLLSSHADLRVSLWEMRERQRNPGSNKGLEGHQMPSLRLAKAFQEAIGLRVFERHCVRRADLHRKAKLVRDVRNWPCSFALSR